MSTQQRASATTSGPPPKRLNVPLWLKAVCILLVSVAPIASLALFIDPTLLAALYRIDFPLYEIFVLSALVSGVLLGLGLWEVFFIHRLRSLKTWFSTIQHAGVSVVPGALDGGSDELGELSRLVSYSIVQFLNEREHNKDLLEQKSLFLRVAAHQLRTPLTGLLWSIEALLDPATPAASKEKLLSDVDAVLRRMRLVVNHILASTEIEEGKFGYVFEKKDITPIIQKLADDFKPVAESRGVALSFVHDGVLPVYADSERIALALFDLVSNAIDYTPAGGKVTISLHPEGEKLEVAVEDTGIGILESELPHLFGKFYRSDRARHMRPDGTGLGLFLTRNIINRHGSEITVRSQEGVGSRFSFYLSALEGTVAS